MTEPHKSDFEHFLLNWYDIGPGIDSDNGFSTYYDKESEIDRIMLNQSGVSIVAADNSKFNRCAFAKIADLSVADYIVTDSDVPDALKKKFTKNGSKIR